MICRTHQLFLAEKLSISAATLLAVPFLLVYRGVPTSTDVAIFALALLQLVAATIVARTGRLLLGQSVAFAGYAGLAVTFALSPNLGLAASFAWLALAAIEAATSRDKRLRAVAGVLIIATLATAALGHLAGLASSDPTAAMAGIALLAILPLGQRISENAAVLRRAADHDRVRERALIGALADVVIRFDREGLVDEVSSNSERLLGVSGLDLAGRGLFEHVHVADRPMFLKLINDAAHDAGPQAGLLRLRSGMPHINAADRAEPRHVAVEMRVNGVMLANGRSGGAFAVLRDATPTRNVTPIEAERATSRTMPAAGDGLTQPSRDLRTPLNAIIGLSEMLASSTRRPVSPERQLEYARTIHQSGQQILAMVTANVATSQPAHGASAPGDDRGTITFKPQPNGMAFGHRADPLELAEPIDLAERRAGATAERPSGLGHFLGCERHEARSKQHA